MNREIRVIEAIQYVILGMALLVFLLVWPLGIIHKTEVSKSDEVILRKSDPISVENNGTQMFIAEGTYLEAVDLYVDNDMRAETITFRIYDGDYQQLWETFHVVDAETEFPGFVRIKVDMELEEGWQYYYTVEGLTSDLVLYYEDTNESTSFANGTYIYGGQEMPGINLVIRYIYTQNFSWWQVLLTAVLLFGLALAGCAGVQQAYYRKKTGKQRKSKKIRVQTLIQILANPVIVVAALAALFLVFPGKRFGVGAVNYGFYYIGIGIMALLLLYGVNYRRRGKESLIDMKKVTAQWPQGIMTVSFAGVLWSCYEYMNGLYTIHHNLAACKLMCWFFVLLLCTFGKEQLWRIWNLLYFAAAAVWGYFYTRPYMGMEEEEELFRLQAYVIILGIFVILQIIIALVRLILKKDRVTVKLCYPYAALVAGWMILMVIFRNGRDWVTLMAVLFAMFYFCMWRWEGREKLLSIFCNGIILNFIYMIVFCLMHRPYLRFRHNRYGMGFHTVTMTGYYLALVLCAIVVRLFIQHKKKERWMDCWKELSLLGIGNVYLFITLSRTGYLAAFVMQIFMVIFFSVLWEKRKITAILTSFALILASSIAAFPMVFTAQRILPAVWNDPVYSEIEVWEYVIEKNDPADSELYMDIQAFIKVAGNKLFGMEMGNISLSSMATEIKNEFLMLAQRWKPVYIVGDNYLLASDMEMYEEEDISNGRFEIFASYIEHWNLTGHEEMGVPLLDGSTAVHAHNTFLQMIHDHGLVTGIVFLLLGVISFFYACIRYGKEKNARSHLALTICVMIAFAAAGMVEWIFQICNPFGIAILVVITPLLFRSEKTKVCS